MKLCYNQGCAEGCAGYSMMTTLEAAEKAGFDYADIRFDLLEQYQKENRAEELAAWFSEHRIKPFSYSAFFPFNWAVTEEGKKKVFDRLSGLLPVFQTIGLQNITMASNWAIEAHASVAEIKEDSMEMLNKMADLCEPAGITIGLEFIGNPSFTVNRFETAYDIVKTMDRDSVGLVVDYFHFFAMGSNTADLAGCDGKKIIGLHVNDAEDLPKGAPYFDDSKRFWAGHGCIDNRAMADAFAACGFDSAAVPMAVEVFRPDYYQLTVEENVRTAYETTKAFAEKYF